MMSAYATTGSAIVSLIIKFIDLIGGTLVFNDPSRLLLAITLVEEHNPNNLLDSWLSTKPVDNPVTKLSHFLLNTLPLWSEVKLTNNWPTFM